MTIDVAPGVHRLDVPLGDRRNSVHLVLGERDVLLFDAGTAGQIENTLVPALASLGRTADDVRHVVLSHCDIDHWGGAGDVRDLAPHASFVCHAEERPLIEDTDVALARRYQEFAAAHGIGWDEAFRDLQRSRAREIEVDRVVQGGETIDLGGRVVEILHVPGHSRGHLALWDETTRTVITGDAVLGDSVFDLHGRLVMPPNYRYPADYRSTCARLLALEPEHLLAAHFRPMSGAEVPQFLRTSIGYADIVESALAEELEVLRQATTVELVSALQRRLGPWPSPLGEFGLAAIIIGHLEEWVATGRAEECTTEGDFVRWMPRA